MTNEDDYGTLTELRPGIRRISFVSITVTAVDAATLSERAAFYGCDVWQVIALLLLETESRYREDRSEWPPAT